MGTTVASLYDTHSESDFTFSDVPILRFTQAGQARGFPAATGNRWTLPLEFVYFNGRRLDNTTQQVSILDDRGIHYALVDSGNPSVSMPPDMMAQITNAYAGNRQVSAREEQSSKRGGLEKLHC